MNIIILFVIAVLITASSGCSWTEGENEDGYKQYAHQMNESLNNDTTDSYPESGNDESYVEDNSGSSSSYAGEGVSTHPESSLNSDPED